MSSGAPQGSMMRTHLARDFPEPPQVKGRACWNRSISTHCGDISGSASELVALSVL